MWIVSAFVFGDLCFSFGGGKPSSSGIDYPELLVIFSLIWYVAGIFVVPILLVLAIVMTVTSLVKRA